MGGDGVLGEGVGAGQRVGGDGGGGGGGGRWDSEEGGDLGDGGGLRPVVAVIVAVAGGDEHFGFGGEVGLRLAEASDGCGEKAFAGGGFAERESEMEDGVGFGIESAARGAERGGAEKRAGGFGERDGNGGGHGAESFELNLRAEVAGGFQGFERGEEFEDEAIAERVGDEINVESGAAGDSEVREKIGEDRGGIFCGGDLERIAGEGEWSPGFVAGPEAGVDGRLPFVMEGIAGAGEILQECGVGLAGNGERVVVSVEEENDLAAVSAERAGDLRQDASAGGVGADAEFTGVNRIRGSHGASVILSQMRLRRPSPRHSGQADEARDRKNSVGAFMSRLPFATALRVKSRDLRNVRRRRRRRCGRKVRRG